MSDSASRWKARTLGLALVLIAVALLFAVRGIHVDAESKWLAALEAQPVVAWVVIGVLFATGIIALLSSWDRRGAAIIRLNWFVPMIRRQNADGARTGHPVIRWVRKILPKSWQSDWSKKKRGSIRRVLKALGPSWLASPVRRCVQSVCLLTFCGLFFYTCWPYDAVPRSKQPLTTGWQFVGFDQENNQFEFSSTDAPNEESLGSPELTQGQTVFLLTEDVASYDASESKSLLGEFRFGGFDTREDSGSSVENTALVSVVQLAPVGEMSSAMMGLVLGNAGNERYELHATNPLAWPSHYADNLARKERIPAETFLAIDPLVSLSTAVASRSWVWSLMSAGAILIVCVLIPRGFCGYLCPLGTTIDLFDWAIAGRTKRFRVPDSGWWVHVKYYLLGGIMVAAVFGVLLSGFFSAIPVITRGMLFLVDPLQSGVARGWHLIPAWNMGQYVSVAMFLGVLCLGFLRPRFWCKYVCPSGAVFSIGNLFRATERKVESSCINCNKCVEVCPFDAIKPDFTTRETDCTLCQTCGGVCPTHAIKFVERWNVVELKVENDPPTHETALGRRGFLSLAAGSAAAVAGGTAIALGTKAFGARLGESLPVVGSSPNDVFLPVRPPGSVPEQEFLQICIRCGECFKACPNNVLQPEGFQQGLEGLWSPMVNADWAGCESSCNACGQVCPTGAIRALPMEEKRVARMGLAVVNEATCLPFAGKEACDLCVQECDAAGYHAIEYTQVGVEVDEAGLPIEGTGYAAPVVLADKCVGCGLCQTRCNVINVKDRHVLDSAAIVVEAGEGKEDRLMSGSYLELRRNEQANASEQTQPSTSRSDGSGSDPSSQFPQNDEADPFGVESSSEKEEDPFGMGAAADSSDPFGVDSSATESAPNNAGKEAG